MDPLALAAVVGLVFAGKRLSDDPKTTAPRPPPPVHIMERTTRFAQNDQQMQQVGRTSCGRDFQGFDIQPKHEVASFGDINQDTNKRPYGQPVYDLYNRQYVTNKMNNLAPVERRQVGPGIGIGAEVPAAGGFQQYFRVLPNNINEERLTTLEGRNGPMDSFVKNGAPQMGEVTHQAKASKAWFREPTKRDAQGQGGAVVGPHIRPDHIKTKRCTNRQQTGMREDTLEMGPAQYGVYQPYFSVSGTSDKALTRCSDNRSNEDRAGNGQRMNVRADPIGAVGAMTNLRAETIAFPVQAGDASKQQNYIQSDYHRFNEHKGRTNPHMKSMDIAIRQLEQNEIALPPLSVA
jgi:hypothetical protein